MAAGGQLATQGDRREGMSGIPEGGEEEPEPVAVSARPRRAASRRRSLARQTSSASALITCERSSADTAIGLVIRVPTPASR